MSIYFTSDHHFGQAAARSFYRRPFASVAKMDQEMIDRWNSVVRPGEGDVSGTWATSPCANPWSAWPIY
jgi:calcineurin-like phosphoesterase family protein